ncbi:MAG: amidohydrolase [Clostridiales bacterium]|nr:MAG: amidohydrolase [Clostridiales bacterium]
MKTVYFNGKVYLGKGEFTEGFVVEDNKFVKTGSSEEVLLEAKDADLYDLEGKTVIAGINDSHGHLIGLAKTYREVYLMGVESIDDAIEKGKKFIIDNPDSKVINGMGWNSDFFKRGEIRNLTRDDLDKISTELPVIFRRACFHMLTANTKAIEMSGITRATVIQGGDFDYEKGQFFENAQFPVLELISEPTNKEMVEIIKKAMDGCLSQGITTIQINDCTTSGERKAVMNAYKTLFETENNLMRIRHQVNLKDTDEFADFLEKEKKDPTFNTLMQDIGPMKLFKDGSLGARSALVNDEYADSPGNTGIAALTVEEADVFLKFAHDNDMQVVTHVIGDRAFNEMANSYAKYTGEENPLRWGLIHTQLSGREELDLLTKYNIPTLVQPIFLRADIPNVKKAVSEKLQSTSYAFGTMVKEGVHLSLSTDTPIEPVDPFANIYWAVTRKAPEDKEAFYPEHCMSVEDAVDAYTIESAYIEFKEDFKGRIKEGYLADFIVLDKDIFTIDKLDIPSIKVLMTVLDGNVVYKRD